MAIKTLNSVGGFSVKDISGNAVIIIDSNGNVSTPNLTVSGQSNLGPVGNVKITGGGLRYVMTTDGSANLTWESSVANADFANNANYASSANYADHADTAATAQHVTASSQSNITSVGTLVQLDVNGPANLGYVSNVHIDGGSTGYVLTTDGAGNLTWSATGSPTIIQNGTSNVTIPDLNGNVYVNSTTGEQWNFQTNGNLTVPGPINFYNTPYGPPGTTNAARIQLFPSDARYAIGVDNYTTWIQSAGYITSYIDTTAVAKTTGSGVAVTGLAISNNVLAGTQANTGVVDFTEASNVTLGNVANVHINGGTNGYVLTTDGAGNLSWAAGGGGGGDGQMPYYIPSGETYTIQLYRQGLFRLPITIDGDLVVNGILVQV